MTAEGLPIASAGPDDAWNEGDPYEVYVGRWSRLVARRFVGWLSLPPSLRWLDVGCGTGALCAAIAESCQPAQLIGVDPSEGFLAKARERLAGRATFHLGTAMDLPLQDASLDVVVSGLVLNFVPSPASGLAEMKRKAVAGATIAAYVWDYAGRMDLMRHFWDAAVELNPDARGLDEGVRFPLCEPVALAELFRNAGLDEIDIAPIEIDTRFRDFDDYWNPFLGGQGPAPGYAMSLAETARARLRDGIRRRLPIEGDGQIPLVARAWAVKGHVPR